MALGGDAKLILRDLIEQGQKKEEKGENRRREARRQKIWQLKSKEEARGQRECATRALPIKSKRVVWELNEVYGANTILVNENGSQDLWSYSFPYYRVMDQSSGVAPGEQTCMGFGVAAAIGAKLAAPEKKVVWVTGDGAFQMFMKELPTARQYQAPVTYNIE